MGYEELARAINGAPAKARRPATCARSGCGGKTARRSKVDKAWVCNTCERYERRKGVLRPEELIVRRNAEDLNRRLAREARGLS